MIRVVVGLIIKEQKILVAKRPFDKPYAGYWEFPGGKIEENESAEEALKRELAEELGIEVLNAAHCFQHTHSYPDKTVLLQIWKITAFSGEVSGKENQELRWVCQDEMLALNLLEGNLAIRDKIYNAVKSSKSSLSNPKT